MTSTIKVDNIQNQCGANIINESANTITIGASGDTIQLAAGASQTGFGRTGTVDWDTTAKTASFTAVSGNGYFVNTTSGAITVTLPAGSAGDIVSLADYAATWQTNNVTVTPNGTDKIGGVNSNATLSTVGQSVTFVYTDSTQGWINTMDSTSNARGASFITATGGTITTCGNCKIHTFTGPGTFCVSAIATCSANNQVSYIVVAGGGSGGSAPSTIRGAGGGGAGGFREDKSPVTPYTASPLDGAGNISVTATAFPITVGAGGSGNGTVGCNTNGSNSVFSTITSAGGGKAGGESSTSAGADGDDGGSGGGGGVGNASGAAGSGNTPSVTPAQGTNGGSGSPPAFNYSPANNAAGGGGGGATGQGTNGQAAPSTSIAGPGGAGVSTSISGSSTAYAGGGGGAAGVNACTKGSGGLGGGGNGDCGPGGGGAAGTANTGGGGGGAVASPVTGFNGGSGIVIIRYKYQ